MMNPDQDHLEQLVKHPGWLLLREHLRQEWGAKAYAEKLDRVVTEPEAAVQLRGLRLAKDAVLAAFAWPEEQLVKWARQRDQAAEPPSMVRGGR